MNQLLNKKFAETHWEIADVKVRKPEWTDEQCANWLAEHSGAILDAAVEAGNEVLDMELGDQVEDFE